MAHLIKEFGVINEPITDAIIKYVQEDPGEFSQSLLYMASTQEKIIDEEKRNSRFKTIVDKSLFDNFDKLIKTINEKDEFFDYSLVRNDITFIKYSKGGFFKPHEDFLSYKSNVIEEYTLILCADADCDGGTTIFEVNEYFTHKSLMSKTPKNCIIFRKDLKHAGEIITRGYKHIITANLLCIAKTSKNILVVSFPNSDKKYVLSCDQVRFMGNTFFLGILTFNRDEERVNYYEEKYASIDEFEIIYKIFNRSYINIEEFKFAKECINYYCIEYKKILFSPYNGKKTAFIAKNDLTFKSKIMICTTQDETNYYHNLSKELGYSYEPFKVIFAEGIIEPGGGLEGNPDIQYKMRPVFMSLTTNENILFLDKLWKPEESDEFEIDETDDALHFRLSDKILIDNPNKDMDVYNIEYDSDEDDDDVIKILSDESLMKVKPGVNVFMGNPEGTHVSRSQLLTFVSEYIKNNNCMYKKTNVKECIKCDKQLKLVVTSKKSNEITMNNLCDFLEHNLLECVNYDDPKNFDIHINNDRMKVFLEEDIYYEYLRKINVYNFRYCLQNKDLSNIISFIIHNEDLQRPDFLPIKTSPINDNFTPQDYKNTISTMKKLDFFNYIKNKLNTTKFVMPQIKETVESYFCNESVYGEVTLIVVSGLLKVPHE